jgi:hypothetical protein
VVLYLQVPRPAGTEKQLMEEDIKHAALSLSLSADLFLRSFELRTGYSD